MVLSCPRPGRCSCPRGAAGRGCAGCARAGQDLIGRARRDQQPWPASGPHSRLLPRCRCGAGVEHKGSFPSTRLGAVGRGRLGPGSSVPLERVLEELHAPGMERRRDGQREGGMRAMEGTPPPQHPEAGCGSAGSPCARTQLRSCPAWSSALERDGDLRGMGGLESPA